MNKNENKHNAPPSMKIFFPSNSGYTHRELTDMAYDVLVSDCKCIHCGKPFPEAHELHNVDQGLRPVRSWIGFNKGELNLVHRACYDELENAE